MDLYWDAIPADDLLDQDSCHRGSRAVGGGEELHPPCETVHYNDDMLVTSIRSWQRPPEICEQRLHRTAGQILFQDLRLLPAVTNNTSTLDTGAIMVA